MEDVPEGADAPSPEKRYLPVVQRSLFTRRRFITVVGGSGIGTYLWHADLASAGVAQDYAQRVRDAITGTIKGVAENIQANPNVPTAKPTRTMTVNLARREDMLRLRIEFFNLVPSSSNPNQLVKKNAKQVAYAVVNFPPQHLAEEALLRVGSQPTYPGAPAPKPGDGANEFFNPARLARARLAGESRLVFEVPDNALPMARTQAGVLDWLKWKPRLAPSARIPNDSSGPEILPPTATSANEAGQTALEIPWRLQLSPLPGSAWAHRTNATASNGVFELWHTRLAGLTFIGGLGGNAVPVANERLKRNVRAIWSLDKNHKPNANGAPPNDLVDDDDKTGAKNSTTFSPFRTSLSPRNRVQIVQNSSGYKIKNTNTVKPIDVNRLMLTPLGGTIDLLGKWDEPKSLDLILWRHRAALGRDSFVEVIERGFFMPWGFPAVRIKVTERDVENRDFSAAPGGKLNVAFLRQRIFYVILDPTLDFPASGHAHAGRELPFRQIRAKSEISPDVTDDTQLFEPALVPSFGSGPDAAYRWELEATDWEGNIVSIRQPMAFLYFSEIADPTFPLGFTKAAVVRAKWNALPSEHVLKSSPMNGQTVAFAAADKGGDTAFETSSITTNVSPPTTLGKNKPWFVPVMQQANVRVEAAEALSGSSLEGTNVAFPDHYRTSGFAGNAPSTFLSILGDAPVDFGTTEHAGGVAAPSLKMTAISRARGAIGGSQTKQLANQFDPSEWFSIDAKLLGLNLIELIANGSLEKSMTMRVVDNVEGRSVLLNWAPDLQADDKKLLLPKRGSTDGSFSLDAKISRKPDGTTTSDIRGDLQDVTLQLLGTDLPFLDVEIRRLIFTSHNGTTPHLDVRLGEIRFKGPLEFVNELRQYLANPDGPVGVDVSSAGIVARAGVSLPSVGVGIFSLKNLALSAEIGVPFTGDPTYAKFAISSKQDPFLVAVSIFGGGGWFALGITTQGLQSIEAGFEFGGTVSLDFGVAGGSIEVMAGIYFKMEKKPQGDRIQLSGYVRLHGEVHVGFVSVGLLAELELSYVTYEKGGDKFNIATGRCEVTLELPIAPDVSFEIEKSFGGDPHDPRFIDQIEPDEWVAYANAFASED